MAYADVHPGFRYVHGDWVRRRTLTVLRWVSIVGQGIILLAAPYYFDLVLPVGPCALHPLHPLH